MLRPWFYSLFSSFALIVWCAHPAVSQEISFQAGDADETLEDQLRSASLLVGLEADADTSAQDIVAAARADYRRLLTALYTAGYYGPDISIRLNGIEASNIAPLDAPSNVGASRLRLIRVSHLSLAKRT